MSVIKVLIVDDSALVRQTFRTLLESDPEIKVIGTAGDPYIAVQKIQKEKPDVITLDVEMPRMDGITFLKKIMTQAPMPVVVISNQTLKGADVALRALEVGATDVMEKPSLATPRDLEESRVRLIDTIRSAFFAGKRSKEEGKESIHERKPIRRASGSNQKLDTVPHSSAAVIAVGASTGGTEAIRSFLEVLPGEMPPILIVQHMPEKFTASFAKRLNECSSLEVKEASHNELVKPNHVYIAPGNHHMSIVYVNGVKRIRIADGDLVNRHRPSVNVLFHSVAEVAGKHAIGIILTGMGDDGAAGLLHMKERGALTIAQDEATSVVYGMPYKAVLNGAASKVVPLHEIPSMVIESIAAEA